MRETAKGGEKKGRVSVRAVRIAGYATGLRSAEEGGGSLVYLLMVVWMLAGRLCL